MAGRKSIRGGGRPVRSLRMPVLPKEIEEPVQGDADPPRPVGQLVHDLVGGLLDQKQVEQGALEAT